MWLWQHKNARNRTQFWLKIVGFCSFVHIALLGYFFFVYKEKNVLNLTLNKALMRSDVPVVFLPLQKRVTTARQPSSVGTGKKQTKVAKKQQPKQRVEPKKKAPEKKPATSMVEKKPEAKPLAVKKEVAKKTPPKPEVPKIVPSKKEIPKEPAKQDPVVEKKEIELPKIIEPEKPVMQNVQANQEVVQEGLAPDDQAVMPLYVGREDLQAHALYGAVCNEIVEKWRVPVGVSPDLVCQVRMVIDSQGKAQQITIVQSSGVLLYDVSARAAVARVTWPKAAWAKEFTITFKQ